MDDMAVRSMREQTIYAVRSNMRRDDVCYMIVPSDLRLLIGAIDAKDERIAALEVVMCEAAHIAAALASAETGHARNRIMSVSNMLNSVLGRGQSSHGDQFSISGVKIEA